MTWYQRCFTESWITFGNLSIRQYFPANQQGISPMLMWIDGHL